MNELILHIGMAKTGTSALQSFFLQNRESLAAKGVNLPIFDVGPQAKGRNAWLLTRICADLCYGRNPVRTGDPAYADDCRRLGEVLASGDRVLLSAEDLWDAKGAGDRSDLKGRRADYLAALHRCLKEHGVEKTRVIAYLRRQDLWVASAWKQWAMNRFTKKPFSESLELFDFVTDYELQLNLIEQEFGDECDIRVRVYDKSRFEGGDIARDFCAAADIPWDDAYSNPKYLVNESLSFDSVEALRRLDVELSPSGDAWRELLLLYARRVSSRHPDPVGLTPFAEGEDAYLERYSAGNRAVAQRYLGRDELFSPLGDEGRPVWDQDSEKIDRIVKTLRPWASLYDKAAAKPLRRAIRAVVRRLPV